MFRVNEKIVAKKATLSFKMETCENKRWKENSQFIWTYLMLRLWRLVLNGLYVKQAYRIELRVAVS